MFAQLQIILSLTRNNGNLNVMQPNALPRELHTNHAACGGASTSPVSRITDPSVEPSMCRVILEATNISKACVNVFS